MARIVIDLSENDLGFLTREAKANGFETAKDWVDQLFRQHLANEFLARKWRLESDQKENWFDNLVTDPGGGVWHEDDYPGE